MYNLALYNTNLTHKQVKVPQIKPLLRETYHVYLEKGLDGWIIAKCPELNIVTQGKTDNEAVKNAVKAADLMVEELGKGKEFTLIPIHKFSV